MANIRTFRQKTKDGKEITRYMLDYVNRSGKRCRLRLPKGTTRKDAKQEQLRVEERYELKKRNRYRPIKTLEEAHNWYLASRSRKCKAGHVNLIKQSHRQLLKVFGNIKMSQFDEFDGDRFLQYLLDRSNLSESTFRTYAYYAKLFFDWARMKGQIDFDMIRTSDLPTRQPSEYYLTEKQLEMVYDEILATIEPAKRLELLSLFLLLTQLGCRISEVLNAPPKNYDFKKHIIQLALVKKKKRNVIVHSETMKLLEQLYNKNKDKGKVFLYRSRWYGEQFKIIFQELDIPFGRKPLHLLRHTFCTLAIQDGVGIEDISRFVGHSDSKVTYQNYIHVAPVIKSAASEFGDRTVTSLLRRSPDDNMSHAS